MIHTSVLVKEILDLLNLKNGDAIIDATMGEGGHTNVFLDIVGETGKVLGIEQDAEIAKRVPKIKNLVIALGNFMDIDIIAEKNNFKNIKVILFDLGISSWHYQESGRGFSFSRQDEPLIMKLGSEINEDLEWNSAAEIVNQVSEKELSDIFFKYGEERRARRIAKNIVEARRKKRIVSVGDFLKAAGIKDVKQKARIFQALRIAVNNELLILTKGIEHGFKILAPKGRMAIIAYHSLEDRIVKKFFNEKKKNEEAIILTKKPVTPSGEEIKLNSRARSAKMRVLEKI